MDVHRYAAAVELRRFGLPVCAGLPQADDLCSTMINHRLIASAVAVVCNLTSCAGQQQQVAREQQEHDAECRKFGAAIDTPTYIDCRMALRALERLEQAAHSPLLASIRHGAGGFNFDRDGRKQNQWETHSKGRSEESSCARIRAGQLIVFECGLGLPLADLLTGLDP